MTLSSYVIIVDASIRMMERRLSAIKANWTLQRSDLMNPAQFTAVESEVLSMHEDCGKLLLAVAAMEMEAHRSGCDATVN